MVTAIATVVLIIALIFAVITDVARYEIPNTLPIVITVAFLAAAIGEDADIRTIVFHLAAGMIVLIAFGVLFWKGWMGGGDVKLIAASAVWAGGNFLLQYLVVLALFGGVLALVVVLLRLVAGDAARINRPWVQRLLTRRQGVPYGVAISATGLFLLPYFPLTGWQRLIGLLQ